MKLLISNDDGIFALGVRSLANTLAQAGYDVTVVCPDTERSATGHGLTLHHPIRAEIIESVFDPKVTAWSCSGTPADCVKFALSAVMKSKPDFVVAGINHGPNLGTDIIYSGTVSAAMEGLLEGITSLAVSLANYTSHEFQPAANFTVNLLKQLSGQNLARPTLFNINVPAVKATEITGVIITRQGLRRYIDTFQKRLDPRGKSYYWLTGEVIEELEQPEHLHLPKDILTDVQAIKNNAITITPLQYNLTDISSVETLTSNQDEFTLE